MATSVAAVAAFPAGSQFLAWDIIATADADTTLVIAHGFSIPAGVTIASTFRTLLEPVATLDATNLTLTN